MVNILHGAKGLLPQWSFSLTVLGNLKGYETRKGSGWIVVLIGFLPRFLIFLT